MWPIQSTCNFDSTPDQPILRVKLFCILYYTWIITECGIVFLNLTDEELLRAYSDADWVNWLYCASVGCTSGMTVKTVLTTVATSTMKAGYMAAYAAIQEIVWIRGVMTELGLKGFQLSKDASPTILNMDSKSAIDLAQNPVNHKRSKHIRIKYH